MTDEHIAIILIQMVLLVLLYLDARRRGKPVSDTNNWIMFQDEHPSQGELVTVRLLHLNTAFDVYEITVATFEWDEKTFEVGSCIAWKQPTRSEVSNYGNQGRAISSRYFQRI